MAKTSEKERKYHADRAAALKQARLDNPGVTIRNLRDVPGGLSLAQERPLGQPQPKAKGAEAEKPKRARKARAKPLKEYNDAPTEMTPDAPQHDIDESQPVEA